MAGFGREGKALLPLRYVANLFKDQTIAQLQNNFMTQRIWPYEVYPGYREVAKRRKHGNSDAHPNGEGVKSFHVYVENDDPFQMTLIGEYNDYLKYVDLGVGGWGEPTTLTVLARPNGTSGITNGTSATGGPADRQF